MPSSTARVIGNDLTLATGGKVKNCTAAAASGEVMEYDQVRTMVATGATDNKLLRADGTQGHTVQGSAVSIDDSGRASNSGNALVDVGAGTSDVNRTVTGGGANNTFDVPIPDDSCVRAIVESWVLINGKYEHLISEVLCRRISAGTVVVHDVTRNTYTPDPSGGVIDSTYHAFAASTSNLRLTRKAHGSLDGIWSTHVWLTSTTKPQ